MITEFLEEQAALYVTGLLPADKREAFELLLQCHEELRHFTAQLTETSALLAASESPVDLPADLKTRVLNALADHPQAAPEALVRSDAEARVQWVNPAFTEMCGHALEDLRDKKLGPILQGAKTDPETAGRVRKAVRDGAPCHEILLNYHKDGRPYWVEITFMPIKDDAGKVLCFVARESERTDIPLP